jgi:Bacterial Ig-like domain
VRWAGTVNPGSGFGIDAGADGQLMLEGALRFEAAAERLGSSLRVRSAAAPLTVRLSVQGLTFTDVLTQIDATKGVRRDTARATASFTLRVASDLLGGAIAVSTETPFRAWFDTFPDQGVVRVSGAGSTVLRVSAIGGTSQRLAVSLDGAQLGTIVALEGVDGYLWSGTGVVPQDPTRFPYVILTELAQPFKIISGPDGSAIPPALPLTWQFSRPLAPDTPIAAEFRANISNPGWPTITATATVEGSLYTIVPTSSLEPGVTYDLVLAGQISDGVRDNNGVYIQLINQFTVSDQGGN